MPSNNTTPTRPPVLVICLVALTVVAVLGVTSAVILTALDANASPDLPDPLVNNVGDFAASTSIIAMILLGIHILRTTSTANTRAGVAAIADARRDLKDDTGEIPAIREAVRRAEVIVVREPDRGWPHESVDHAFAARPPAAAAASLRPSVPPAKVRGDEMTDAEWRAYMSGYYDSHQPGPDSGPEPVA